VALVRFAVGIAAVATEGLFRPLRAHNRLGLVWRGVFGGTSVLCYFLSIQHLPVGLATLLNYTAPVFTAFWAAMFLNEKLDALAVVALLLAFCGVVLVAEGTAHGGAPAFARWVIVGAIGAMFSGAAVATIRHVRRTDGAWEVFGSFCVVGALINAPPAVSGWIRPMPFEWLLLFAVGVTSVAAQMALTWGLRYVRAAPAGVTMQLTPVATLALGYFLYGERVSTLSAVGAAITLSAVSFDAWRAARPQVPAEQP
jgi:drug/metabolite transporter (DMT)-like permease